MGGVDKGLEVLRGRPMVAWVIERFAPQVDEILINANQNLETYCRARLPRDPGRRSPGLPARWPVCTAG